MQVLDQHLHAARGTHYNYKNVCDHDQNGIKQSMLLSRDQDELKATDHGGRCTRTLYVPPTNLKCIPEAEKHL